jgi:hypothetical protein
MARPQETRFVFDKVLYFPHIRVPDNEWFTPALLYWDEVGDHRPARDRPT